MPTAEVGNRIVFYDKEEYNPYDVKRKKPVPDSEFQSVLEKEQSEDGKNYHENNNDKGQNTSSNDNNGDDKKNLEQKGFVIYNEKGLVKNELGLHMNLKV